MPPRAFLVVVGLGLLMSACTSTAPTRTPEPPRERVYRLQVHMTAEKESANAYVQRVRTWWDELPQADRPAGLGPDEPAVEIVWQQPYYRVRLGRFDSRSAAEDALEVVGQAFPRAFVVSEMRTPAR